MVMSYKPAAGPDTEKGISIENEKAAFTRSYF